MTEVIFFPASLGTASSSRLAGAAALGNRGTRSAAVKIVLSLK
jgi:hypothetical protein